MKQSKNYIGLVNDHSGSMRGIAHAALKDYNTNIGAIKDAASREMLDTVVSVIGIGLPGGSQTERQVVVSNPHVLKAITNWPTPGGTPLYDGIGDMIELFDSLPDIKDEHVSVLVMVTTDGGECHSHKYNMQALAAKIKARQDSGRWTFVLRVPKDQVNNSSITNLGIPADNIQGWDTTAAGMEASTKVSTQAMDSYFAARSAGKKSSSSFYADASKVNLAALEKIPSKLISEYIVGEDFNGGMIRDFILTKRMKFLKGSAFFQLTKTEAKLGHDKIVLLRDKATGNYFGGASARQMLGLPTDQNARLHPGDHGQFDIFIQSKSINRKLVAGSGVMYWEAIGTPFTQEEIDLFTKPPAPKKASEKPAVNKLIEVKPTNKPTKSPLVPTPRRQFAATRDDARILAKQQNKTYRDNGSGSAKGERWEVI